VTAVGTRSGILLVDKPQGLTSHDVVSRTRKAAGTRKVGHAGTLDPMATGLLVLGLNSSTRLLTYLVGLDKEYFATIRLGVSTSTDDAEGEVLETGSMGSMISTGSITDADVAEGIRKLTGPISQVPSSVSAIKVDGKRAYDRVREGETFELKPRNVTISRFEVLDRRGDELHVRVECSSGTYIRALARDLGADLGVGGHLTALRRTRIGPFTIDNASELEGIDVAAGLIAPAAAASTLFETVTLSDSHTIDLTHGKRFSVDAPDGSPVAAVTTDGRLVGLVTIAGGRLTPIINFPTDEVLA
jgi:tRNA pseudouridine55 synthase